MNMIKIGYLRVCALTIAVLSLLAFATNPPETGKGIKHVVVIGFDGLSPDGLNNAKTPNFDKLMKEGAYTLYAQAVLPTKSSPNWASMIMGVGPERHGITTNRREKKDKFNLPTVVVGEGFLFPTIFSLVDSQVEGAEIGAIYQWEGFGRLFEKSAVDYDIGATTEDEIADLASEYIGSRKPTFTFIHFDHVDGAGHEFGHGSAEYYQSVEKADLLLAQVIDSILSTGIQDQFLVLVSSDHGGLGKKHGGESLEEIEVPFIAWGKPIKENYKIPMLVYQYDNAATVAFALGLERPDAWTGKPLEAIFK